MECEEECCVQLLFQLKKNPLPGTLSAPRLEGRCRIEPAFILLGQYPRRWWTIKMEKSLVAELCDGAEIHQPCNAHLRTMW